VADYTIATGEVASHNHTLTPNTEDTVTLPVGAGKATLILWPSGSQLPVWVTTGSNVAAANAATSRVMFPGTYAVVSDLGGALSGLSGAAAGAAGKVRLISAAAITYSVEV
jgi:hypothetical protein